MSLLWTRTKNSVRPGCKMPGRIFQVSGKTL
nr:MAG TPA: hypothetical protein [Caudoviricetes sp.]DAZ52859.1 MAG TPA: hypothetical protein [Caudoviricetes sp.]